jgi:FtsZ-interacting cell division protein ZipA
VTHVTRAEQPFLRLRQAAQALAEAMDGVVTDDGGAPLTADTMDRIGADLEALYDALDARDLSAGSPQARRLFS